jgi:pyruvate formate lyase activating enzyme
MAHEALLYHKLDDKSVACDLCNHRCEIAPGRRGKCGVRENQKGNLVSLVYAKAISCGLDPIEKKPLFHFHPGSYSLSIATVGCNFRCVFCQNSDISQMPRDRQTIIGQDLPPNRVVEEAKRHRCRSISYTYTEPTIFFEYAYDTGTLAHEAGILNNFVTNGYMTPEALDMLHGVLDAANVDLKSFREEYYAQYCGAHLEPVLTSIRTLKEIGIWIEVTTLIIPGLNDSDQELQDIAGFLAEVGVEIPWHVSRFFPHYHMTDIPPTPLETLERAYEIGKRAGLRYIYGGNAPGRVSESTVCHNCGTNLIERIGFEVTANRIRGSRCPTCSTEVAGVGMDGV